MNCYTHYQSPVGRFTLQANDQGLTGSWFDNQSTAPADFGTQHDQHPVLQQAIAEYQEYFAGTRQHFDVPTDPQGTDFQKQVWKTLQTIPFGETWSYQTLAITINNAKAVRAVGLANGKNPISIIIPCHRVIGKNGKLTGYAGGIENKRQLLLHESQHSELLSIAAKK